MSRRLAYLGLSVLHNNQRARALYHKLGFRKLATFIIKCKNGINRPPSLGPGPEEDLNPYTQIIVDEAHRRGIEMRVDDAKGGLFALTQGGRQIRCRESLSNLTMTVSITLYQDRVLTRRALQRAGLRQSQQRLAGSAEENVALLTEHSSLVVRPMDGEQGRGMAVDLHTAEEVEEAVEVARHFDSRVLLESCHAGHDLRVLVISYKMVAAAIRHSAAMIGDGRHSIRELIEAQNRRRQATTGRGSRIPLGHETERTLRAAGHGYDDVLPGGEHLAARHTANLHTGGILEDVTDALHPALREATIQAARALKVPVVSLDFLVEAADQPDCVVIEANKRAGLANHEPQPTAERFIGLLLPFSREVPS